MAHLLNRLLDEAAARGPDQDYLRFDGLAISYAEAVGLVRDTVKDPQLCAKRLVTEALSRGSSWADYGKGRQAWDGWGGDAGERWARSIARRMDAAERRAAS